MYKKHILKNGLFEQKIYMNKVEMKKNFNSCEKPIRGSLVEEMFAEIMPEVRFVDCGVATEIDTKNSIRKPYFNGKNFKLYHSNCLDLLAEMPENSVDMIFADPPYLLSNGGFSIHAGRQVSVNKGTWDKSKGIREDFEFHLDWITACRRVLKPEGTIWISGTYHSIYQCGFALQSIGFHILNDIAWFKPSAPPNLSCRFFTASHETLIWARKDKKAKHCFNYSLMKSGQWDGDFIKKSDKQMRSVWAIGAPKDIEKRFGKHPTQKPEDLLKRIILASTKKGDLIVDPFTGSSTTGVIAHLLGRDFIGIDMEEKFLDLSIKRFEVLENNLNKKFNFHPVIMTGASILSN